MEYRGRIFVVVYVGAIAVLFRFVVMMLNVTGVEERKGEKEEGVGRTRTSKIYGRKRICVESRKSIASRNGRSDCIDTASRNEKESEKVVERVCMGTSSISTISI